MRADILEQRCAEMRARLAPERAKRLAQAMHNKSFSEKTKEVARFLGGCLPRPSHRLGPPDVVALAEREHAREIESVCGACGGRAINGICNGRFCR